MKQFEELGLSQDVVKILKEKGFESPTEIQKKTIPLALAGRDVLGGSATGSGKTLVFAAPIIENLKQKGYVQALILTPTRELAEQVSDAIREFSKKNLKIAAVYGGVDMDSQLRRMRYADVIVGTPGRVIDHMKRRNLDLGKVKILVLDECDRMFDMGFHRDVEMIIQQCPKIRQTMLFSATISADIDYFSKKYTTNPVEVSVSSYVDDLKLRQIYYDVPDHLKFSLLVHLLKQENAKLVMVFCNTRRNVDFVVANLEKSGIDAKAIHGGLEQKKRIRVLENFHEGKVGVLVCTDVAARGLDIKGVTHIYNYDAPKEAKDYVHRIGRTARAGEEGEAINLVASRDYENFRKIMDNEELSITSVQMPLITQVEVNTNFGKRSGGFGGRGEGRSYGRSSGRSSGSSYRGGSRGSSSGGRSYGRSSSSSGRSYGRSSGGSYSRGSSSSGRSYSRSSSSDRSEGRGSGSRDRGRSSGSRDGGRSSGRRPSRGSYSRGRR